MYELTNEQFLSIPFDSDFDNKIVTRLIRLSTDAKRLEYPEIWGESVKDRPVVNLRYKSRGTGIIIAGELSFYCRDVFVTVGYDRKHDHDIEKYKVKSNEGRYYINQIWAGTSPLPRNRTRLARWRTNESSPEWNRLMEHWRKLNREKIL